MAGSLIFAVRQAVTDGLSDETDLEGVEIGLGWKAGSSARERIFTRNATFDLSAAALKVGRNFRNEVATFDLVILVEGVGLVIEDTAARALEIGTVCEEFIADRKSNQLGIAGLQTLQMAGTASITEMFSESGAAAELAYPVRYTARLT